MKININAAENLITVYNNADAKLAAWYSENSADADLVNDFNDAKMLIDMHNDDCWWMVSRAESYGLKADAEHWAAKVIIPLRTLADFNHQAYLTTNDMTMWSKVHWDKSLEGALS